MFDIGFWELLLIGIVALLVLGPERLPSAIRSTVKTVRDVKEMANGFKQEVSHQLKISELHEHLKEAEKSGLGDVSEDVRKSVEELKAAAASVQQPYAKKALNHNAQADSADKPKSHKDESDKANADKENSNESIKNDTDK